MEDGEWRSRLASANLSVDYEDWRVAVVLSKDGNTARRLVFRTARRRPCRGALASVARVRRRHRIFDDPARRYHYRPAEWQTITRWPKIPDSIGRHGRGGCEHRPRLCHAGWLQPELLSKPFNRATQAERQPGSSIKPFVYAAALGKRDDPVIDHRRRTHSASIRAATRWAGNVSATAGGGVAGPQTLRWGLEQSRNLMTVRAASETGMENIVELIRQCRASASYEPFLSHFSLGAGDTTVLRLVNAYGMLANHGRDVGPSLIDYVQNRDGEVIFPANWRACEGCNADDWNGERMPRPPIPGRQIVDPMTAFQMVHILQGVIQRGTATILRDLNRPHVRQNRHDDGPDQCLVCRRNARHRCRRLSWL